MTRTLVSVRDWRSWWHAPLAAALSTVLFSQAVVAWTPEDPEVRSMIERAKQFLETMPAEVRDERLGGQCLVGLVFVKEGQPNHPRVREAVRACREYAARSDEQFSSDAEYYSLGLAVTFLCDHDSAANRAVIQRLLGVMQKVQKDHGGWGYAQNPTGDTSMSQYAVLGIWSANRAGFSFPQRSVEAFAGWLVRTQDPSGAWGYQGVDSLGGPRVAQNDIRMSLVTAGLGSLYLCAELLDPEASAPAAATTAERPTGTLRPLPAVFRLIEDEPANKRWRTPVPKLRDQMRKALQDGDGYFQANYNISVSPYGMYYLYALERYQTIRELRTKQPDPRWYDQGVEHLRTSQTDQGRFPGDLMESVDTAFGALFLMRSTQRALRPQLYDGRMLGGRGIPANLAGVDQRQGRLLGTPKKPQKVDSLELLSDEQWDPATTAARVLELREQDLDHRSLGLLRRWARGTNREKQRLAVEWLARQRNMDHAPYLIAALDDQDEIVSRAALRGLRRLARELRPEGLEADTQQPTDWPREAERWRSWYRSIEPEAALFP